MRLNISGDVTRRGGCVTRARIMNTFNIIRVVVVVVIENVRVSDSVSKETGERRENSSLHYGTWQHGYGGRGAVV